MDKRSARLTVFEVALFGVLGALTFGAKFVMSFLPNIEPASLMVMLFAVVFGWKGLFPTYVYVVMEILVYGPNVWNVPYLYIWVILFVLARVLRSMTHPLAWAILSGAFGLAFGALCLPTTWIMSGFASGLAWWIYGIPYDLLHCAGNFVIALVLFVPLRKLLDKLYTQTNRPPAVAGGRLLFAAKAQRFCENQGAIMKKAFVFTVDVLLLFWIGVDIYEHFYGTKCKVRAESVSGICRQRRHRLPGRGPGHHLRRGGGGKCLW